MRLKKRTKGKPTFKEISREGSRVALDVPKRVHKKGNVVQYKGGLAHITKSTKKGIYVMPYKSNGILEPQSKKPIFISNKKIDKGEVQPFFTKAPLLTPFIIVVKWHLKLKEKKMWGMKF